MALIGASELIAGQQRRTLLRDRAGAPPRRRLVRALVHSIDDRLRRTRPGRELSLRLLAAGLALDPLAFVALSVAVAALAYALGSLAFSAPVAIVLALLALRGCFLWLERRREARTRLFAAQLPDLARTLSNGAAAGLSVTAALEMAAGELDDPARRELTLALEEVRIGQALQTAMAHVEERMPSRELAVLVNTLAVQQRAGGDLVHALSDMADTLEARKDTIREVRTVMAGAVATAYIVAGLGIVSVFVLDLINPGSLEALTGSALGIAVLIVSATLYAAGFALVRRVTRIET